MRENNMQKQAVASIRNAVAAARELAQSSDLARRLRAEPDTRAIVMQLDAAMREAGVPTQWEH
jgi:hypothetical protein